MTVDVIVQRSDAYPDARVQVLWAHAGSRVRAMHLAAQGVGRPLILPEGHELAKLAFAGQS